jgi:outer membrane receptor protein involved in Fe transport
VRYQVAPWLIGKASYELSTRLPVIDEVFGDGILVRPNLEIEPERSHNANLGARMQWEQLQLDVNAFARLTDNMIILINSDRTFVYQNVYAARILGIEAGASYVAPGEWASLEGSVTVQDIRNASSSGPFGQFDGDRIPNRPWLLGALAGTVRHRKLVRRDDEIALFANSRYVHEFYRGWESVGTASSKQVLETQFVHGVGVTYALRNAMPIVTTAEVSNLLDARVFDSFGVQRPGRAFYLKLSVEM